MVQAKNDKATKKLRESNLGSSHKIRSSNLAVSSELRGQDRILEIVRQLGAQSYVNAPGGRDLYDHQRFAEAGVELCFLPDHHGTQTSILSRLLVEDRANLLDEILAVSP